MLDGKHKNCRTTSVMPELRQFLPDAVSRLAYLYPSVEVSTNGGSEVTLSGMYDGSLDEAVRDLHFSLYRQKIHMDTLPLREQLIRGILGS